MMRIRALDHVGVDVHDMERSVAFYRDVLRLELLPRPEFDFPGAWFRLGPTQELHLIGYLRGPIHGHDRGNHFALEVDDLDAWEAQIRSFGHEVLRRFRPDGVEQMYVSDPDGNVVELFSSTPRS